MKLHTVMVTASIIAVGAKVVIAYKEHQVAIELEEAIKERNRRFYQQELATMAHTGKIADKVLNGEYGQDLVRAMRDMRVDKTFVDIVKHFDE